MLRKMLLGLLLLAVTSANADICQWVDENGKVHYGDSSKAGNADESKDVSVVVIRDKYHVPSVEKLAPLPYQKPFAHRPISFASVELRLPDSESRKVRIDRVVCGRPVDLYWQDGIVDLLNPRTFDRVVGLLNSQGYVSQNEIGSSPSMTNLRLEADIVNFKINVCPGESKKISRNATYVKVRWKLIDPLNKNVLLESTTSGSHNGLDQLPVKDGDKISFISAFAVAANNLMANQILGDVLPPENVASLQETFDETIAVAVNVGSGSGVFKSKVKSLKSNTVIVKTTHGHGSGVILSGQGYILTNAHVVGDEADVKIVIDGLEFSGYVVRKAVVRDVALIKLHRTSYLSGVDVAQTKPTMGDEIFVIGTPLDLANSQTITKGIVSAYRNIQGLEYIQTDAAINRGNSGGPVFSEAGELVALTVSGMFTRDGANLSINYLIPIDSVLKSLSIDMVPKEGVVAINDASTVNSTVVVHGIEHHNVFVEFFKKVVNWLDTPIL